MIFGALMWGVCIYAWFRGGRAERLAATGIVLMTYLSVLVASPYTSSFRHVEWPMFMVDASLFFVLLGVSLKSEKYWPIWLTAMQGLTVLTHLAPYVPHVIPWAYGNANAIWAYPMLIILAFATRQHRRRLSDDGFSVG